MSSNNSKGVKICSLVKVYKGHQNGEMVRAVDDISVDIRPGEFVTLLGPSGCGKTTTLRMVAGFEEITGGEIYIGDELVNHVPPDKRDTAMVFQSYALFPNYNIYDNIAYGLKIRKLSKQSIHAKVMDIIRLVGLEGMETRQINQISGGQQQRVALARALVVEPGVLLFDEPLSNLDARLRVHMRTEIRKIQQKLGITALYVTHDQAEAMSLSDRIIILKDGVIEQVGSPSEIYHHPANRFVANFVGTANFIDGVTCGSAEDKVDVNVDGTIYHGLDCREVRPEGSPCTIVVRPESLSLSKGKGLPCKVTLSTFMGEYQYYEASYKNDTLQIHQSNPKAKAKFDVGESAYIQLDAADLFVIY